MDKNTLVYGIIHIGSSNVSMRIVEYKNADDIRVIEEVRKGTSFGEEVFLNKQLSFPSIRRLCDLLNGLKQLLADYQVKVYAVYATAVIREAENRRSILDLIRVNTGFHVQMIDMPQEIYFKHFALQYRLYRLNEKLNGVWGKDFLFVDITSGCVGFTVWEDGILKYQHNIHIGTLRLLEMFKQNQRDSVDFPQALEEYVHAIMKPLWKAICGFKPAHVVLSGREARLIVQLMGLSMDEHGIAVVPHSKFRALYEDAGSLSVSMTVKKYDLDSQTASFVLPILHIYKEILKHVSHRGILMMGMTFIEASSMFYGVQKSNDSSLMYMRSQNLELTRAIASSYYYEGARAEAMESYAQILIRAMDELSGFTERDEFLLRMAIILHSIGKYVNLLEANAHSWSLIRGTDIFGISDKEKDMVACIAYYDHKGSPSDEDLPFRILPDNAKMTVLKLIAIFRIVRVLDISGLEKLKQVDAKVERDRLLISYESTENTALETWMFEREKTLFENVFGVEAVLQRR